MSFLQSHSGERREFGRRKTIKPSRLVVEDQLPISAVVVDISAGGARIQVRCGQDIPQKFNLEIIEDGISVHCEVVHATAHYIGVRFIRLPRRIRTSGENEASRLKNLTDALTVNNRKPSPA